MLFFSGMIKRKSFRRQKLKKDWLQALLLNIYKINMKKQTTRRQAFKNIMLGSATALAAPGLSMAACNETQDKNMLKGNIKHSVCRWTYSFLSLDELCKTVKDIGFAAIDLVGPKEWDILKKHGV